MAGLENMAGRRRGNVRERAGEVVVVRVEEGELRADRMGMDRRGRR